MNQKLFTFIFSIIIFPTNKCMQQPLLESDFASASMVKRAVFSKDNTFKIGEIVIVDSHLTDGYLYGCVTKISPIAPDSVLSIGGEKFSVDIWRKKWNTNSHYFGSCIGKILSPRTLIDLSVDAIVHQIKSGKLKLKDIKLPQELYAKVIRALH